MNTTVTPPPVPPHPPVQPPQGPPPQSPPPSGRRPSSRVVATLAITAGAVILIGAVFTGVFSAVRSSAIRTDTLTASGTGIAELDIEVSATQFDVVYDGDEVVLEVTGSAGASDWALERDGDTLVVSSQRGWWAPWRWFGDSQQRALLTLPERLEDTEINASIDVSSGSATMAGTYAELEIGLSAGEVDITGTAEQVDADVSAGHGRIDLEGVRRASVDLSAGELQGSLAGRLDDLTVDVSAGRVELDIPDETYDIVSDVSAGDFTHDLDTSAGADRTITVTVSAGAAILHAAR